MRCRRHTAPELGAELERGQRGHMMLALRQLRGASRFVSRALPARCSSSAAPTSARVERRAYLARLRDRRDDLEARCGGDAELSAGVIVERTPVVMPDPEDWELAMWELQAKLEVYDGFEYPERVGGGTSAEAEASAPRKEIPEELRALMNRETDADRAGDARSLERCLAEALFLVVRDSADGPWRLPRGALGDDFLREACEGVLASECGSELYTYLLGNGPVGVWDAPGADGGLDRTFFMKAIVVDLYNSGPVDAALTHDHKWITKAELPDHIDDGDYLDFLQKLL